MTDYKTITLNNTNIVYIEKGKGQPVVFVHGFAAYSCTWTYLLDKLPRNKRYLALDLKGFGYSDKPNDHSYSPYDQAKIVIDFIKALKLDNVILVGHSFGGFVSLIALLLNAINKSVKALVLIDSVGYFRHVPAFIATLRIPLLSNITLDALDPQVLARGVLEKVFYNKNKLPPELVTNYASILSLPGAKESLVRSAQQFVSGILKSVHQEFSLIEIPTIIIWGVDDIFIPIVDSYRFRHDIPRSKLAVIPQCGHSPQEECPAETAQIIANFYQTANM